VSLKKVVIKIVIGDVIERDSVDSIGTGIVVEVGVIDVVKEGSTARIEAGIVGDEVSIVEKKR
jgi:hypothetical protein